MSKSSFEDVFDNVVSGTKLIAKKVSSKASAAAENAKLSFALGETQKKLSEIKEKIGDIIYSEYKNGAVPDGVLEEYCKMLANLESDADNIRQKQAELKKSVLCPHCGKLNDDKNTFCAECGERLNNEGEY